MKFRLCFNLGTLGHLDYQSQLDVSLQAGFDAVGLRMDRLEDYLSQGHTLEDAKQCLKKNNLTAVEMDFFPDWIYAKGKDQRAIMDRAAVFYKTMVAIECPLLVATTVCEGKHDDMLARENFREICRLAAEKRILIALEFLPWTPVDTIKKAWDIVKSVNLSNGGIVLDTFHYFMGKPKRQELYEVPIEKIFLFHLDDVRKNNADLIDLCRNYRVLPGEGIFVFDEILDYLFDSRYNGYYALEILNKDYFHEDPVALARRSKESMETFLDHQFHRWRSRV